MSRVLTQGAYTCFSQLRDKKLAHTPYDHFKGDVTDYRGKAMTGFAKGPNKSHFHQSPKKTSIQSLCPVSGNVFPGGDKYSIAFISNGKNMISWLKKKSESPIYKHFCVAQ